ncbi:hypothetical protein pb186bvf_016303 [Paramecium bursaria]
MLIILLIAVTYQQCITNYESSSEYYVVNDETLYVNLLDMISGYNLTYNADNILIKNPVQAVDQGTQIQFQIIAGTVYESQYTKEWFKFMATLQTNSNSISVTRAAIQQDSSPLILETSYLPQQYQLQCLDLTFIDDEIIIVDCYYINGQIYNQFFIIDKNVYYLNNTNSTNFAIFARRILSANDKIIRFTQYENYTGFVEIFQITKSSATLLDTIDEFQITDFQVLDNKLILLNLTQSIFVVNLDTYQITRQIQMYPYVGNNKMYAMDFTADQLDVIIYTSESRNNLIVINLQSQIAQYFDAQLFDVLEVPIQLLSNFRVIALQINQQIHIYSSKVEYNLVTQGYSYLIGLNEAPYKILTYLNNVVTMSYINIPYALLNISQISFTNQMAQISIQATSQNFLGKQICTKTLTLNLISQDNSDIQKKQKQVPSNQIINFETSEFELYNYLSGPMISFNQQENIVNPNLQQNIYRFINITGISSYYSNDFLQYQFFVIHRQYQSTRKYTSVISCYLCQIEKEDYVQLPLNCRLYASIHKINAPISNILLTDMTSDYVQYAAFQLDRVALVIYQFEKLNTSTPQVKFLCEPLTFDTYYYQHSISSVYMIGSTIYLLFEQINQIWLYDVAQCEQTLKLDVIALNLKVFTPVQLVGMVNIRTENLIGQLLFIDSVTEILIVQILDNRVPIVLNQINISSLRNQSLIQSQLAIINNNLILVLVYQDSSIISQYRVNTDQPSLKPYFIKNLPLFGQSIQTPLVITSDTRFLYILLNNGQYYIYDPEREYNSCLMYNIISQGQMIAATSIPNVLQQTIFIMANSQNVFEFVLIKDPLIEVLHDNISNTSYQSQAEYKVVFTSGISLKNVVYEGNMTVYNTLVITQFNQTSFQSANQNGKIPFKSSTFQYIINFDTSFNNNIQDYELLSTKPFSLFLYMNYQNKTANIQGPIFNVCPYNAEQSFFTQNTQGIYLVNGGQNAQIAIFSNTIERCNVLYYSDLTNKLLSMCSFYNKVYLNIYDVFQNTTTPQSFYQLEDFILDPVKGYIIGQYVICQSIQTMSANYQIQIFQLSETIIYIQSIGCSNDGNVGDFTIVQITPTVYAIFYTCPQQQEIYYVIINLSNISQDYVQPSQLVPVQFNKLLPISALLNEIIIIQQDLLQVRLLFTTTNFFSVVYDLVLQQQGLTYTINTVTLINYVAPLQEGLQTRGAIYNNNQLFLKFYDQESEKHLLALSTLNKFYKQIISYLEQPQIICQFLQIQITQFYSLNNNLILYGANLQNYKQQTTQIILMPRYGEPTTVSLQFLNMISGGLSWWQWTVLGLGIIILIIMICLGYYCYRERQISKEEEKDYLELDSKPK